MPIKWKKKFKPDVILSRIASFRTVSEQGGVSFHGWGLHDCLPALQTMLEFPPITSIVDDRSTLVWKAIASIKSELNADAFLRAVNAELSMQLATRESEYHVLTSLSISPHSLPKVVNIEGATVTFCQSNFPLKYESRKDAISSRFLPVKESGPEYLRVIIKVRAKSPHGAFTIALRSLDLWRACLCLAENPEMQLSVHPWVPINVIRPGSIHTVHQTDGTLATETIWFEPNHIPKSPHRVDNPVALWKYVKNVLQLDKSKYHSVIDEALLRYVRAFDDPNEGTAFIGVWGAIESMVSPNVADFDSVVRRVAFLYQDGEYHKQLLEHLREYRNRSVHAGDESTKAKTHCYQLQSYFRDLLTFHLANVKTFTTLDEVNQFLDLPSDRDELERVHRMIRKALKFISKDKP